MSRTARILPLLSLVLVPVAVTACVSADEDRLSSSAYAVERTSSGDDGTWEIEFPDVARGGTVVLDTGERLAADDAGKVQFRSTSSELCADLRVTDGARITRALFSDEPCVSKDPDATGRTTDASLHFFTDAVDDGTSEYQIKICWWKCKIGHGCWKMCTIIKKSSGVPVAGGGETTDDVIVDGNIITN
ncbi:MAG: hypothetical protein F9K40_20650 [Kofleriaceae bacterium]|nr:MAG: hypothetical protein F9K40_20650 [Kofleriaceae bacterium]MBZ0236173.1 hypothetical protein [Kofleriaceae bacterium]